MWYCLKRCFTFLRGSEADVVETGLAHKTGLSCAADTITRGKFYYFKNYVWDSLLTTIHPRTITPHGV